MNDLIDTTEMYLRTIFELEEEGIVPLRARIAERLHQSGPTVSQTVARMERDGLLTVEGDRHLQLSDEGRQLATAVMRKHRLAECLLVDVIGLDYADVHEEACRWEHVMSDAVERKLLGLLGHPSVSPFGNPIPGLEALRDDSPQRTAEAAESGRPTVLATAVMRKHRLAECLLVDVIGLDYADVHEEACRWAHVMSETVERKLLSLLGEPTVSPFGNPIPGLDALRGGGPRNGDASSGPLPLALLSTVATPEGRPVVIERISELLQEDADLLRAFTEQGIRPGASMVAQLVEGSVRLGGQVLPAGVAQHVFVTAADAAAAPLEAAARS